MRRRLIAICVALFVVSAAIFVLELRAYVYPHVESPQKSDVVLVLGPPTKSRIAVAKKMADDGLTHTLLISTPPGYSPSICDSHPAGYRVICFEPDPSTTQGEARMLKDLAAEHKWKSVTVVTFTPHITRANAIVHRCFAGTVHMVAAPMPISGWEWAYQFVYQSFGFIKVALRQGC